MLHKLSDWDAFIIAVCRYVVISIFSNAEVLIHKYAKLCMFCNTAEPQWPYSTDFEYRMAFFPYSTQFTEANTQIFHWSIIPHIYYSVINHS